MRRQLLRLAGTLLCSPVLVRAANTGLTGPVRKRILAAIEQAAPRVLNVQHLALIRRFNIAWSPMESGAPMLNPAQLLPHFMQMAKLKPGNYALDQASFAFTERHQLLLRRQSWRSLEMLGLGAEDYLSEGYWPAPAVDGKRPYGDFTNYPVDMAQALGLSVGKQADGTLTVTPALDKELEALHEQTMPAMQVFVRHAGLMRNNI